MNERATDHRAEAQAEVDAILIAALDLPPGTIRVAVSEAARYGVHAEVWDLARSFEGDDLAEALGRWVQAWQAARRRRLDASTTQVGRG